MTLLEDLDKLVKLTIEIRAGFPEKQPEPVESAFQKEVRAYLCDCGHNCALNMPWSQIETGFIGQVTRLRTFRNAVLDEAIGVVSPYYGGPGKIESLKETS